MHDEDPTETGEHAQGGVFGNLPSSRPGTRSPRRDRAGGDTTDPRPEPAQRASEAAASPAAAKPAAEAQPAPDPAERPEADREPQATDEAARGGLEDLAWAGIAAAAEAATLGVRLAGRAMGAVRDSVDRR
jgi:hypothetical protein